MPRARFVVEYSLIAALLALSGCARSEPSTAANAVPTERRAAVAPAEARERPHAEKQVQGPDEAAQAAVDALENDRPDLLWQALPSSYQRDINEHIHEFARRMDPELWSRLFGSLAGTVELLKSKREFVLDQPELRRAAWVDADELAAHWSEVVGLLETLVNSELADLQQLETIDVGEFLADTGRPAMQQFSAFSSNKFAGARAELVSQEGDRAVVRLKLSQAKGRRGAMHSVNDDLLRFAATGEGALDDGNTVVYELVRVEGKWIPRALADDWERRIAGAKRELEKWTPDFMQTQKQQWLRFLDAVDRVVARLQAAGSANEFHEIVTNQVVAPFQDLAFLSRPGPPQESAQTPAAGQPHGSEGDVVTVVLIGEITPAAEEQLVQQLMSAVDNPDLALAFPGTSDDGLATIAVSPVGNVEVFARRIRFATVRAVDSEQGIITIAPSTVGSADDDSQTDPQPQLPTPR